MSPTRLDQLKEFYNEDPHDPFNIYSLALEYLKSDIDRAKDLFRTLLTEHENYVPTYYHAAKVWLESGDRDQAEKIYEKGITLCRSLGEVKALRELQSAYDEMMFD